MTQQTKSKGCGHNAPALTAAQARSRILETVVPVSASEQLALRDALHRVLAAPVSARVDVPAHTNSAMDGYAVRCVDVTAAGTHLRLVGSSFAGHPFAGQVNSGECVRIMTGAVLPAGADAVIIQEDTHADGERIRCDEPPHPGKHVRYAGEDLARDQVVLAAGRYITTADLGLLASVGIAEVSVFRRPRVAFFSTGDELAGVGTAPAPGQVYDSNRYTLYAMLTEQGVDIHDLGVVRDTPDAVATALEQAADYDAIITSGGVSVGDADYVVGALRRTGHVNYWNVAVKPGRPQAFGRIGNALFFGLPGNPVSVMVGFTQFVRPALVRLAGGQPAAPVQLRLPLTAPVRKIPDRQEYQRGRIIHGDAGMAVVPAQHQGSGVLRSMSEADCFIILDQQAGSQPAGAQVTVEPFAQPVWNGLPEALQTAR